MKKQCLSLCIVILCCLIGGCGRQSGAGLDKLYAELRRGYGGGDTLKAESIVRRMLATMSPDHEPRQTRLLNNGFQQLMYTYIC